ncbi:hypothetical protein FOL47_003423 [Perkinsus chesapeaki]|uniref:Calmodulin n=1 Tax=Perkinsus chesapeaki TaxID=330153 RepID=A0A7J6M809_PERCH|nr:hypothetical protein FOL47_003423 [Perkinsus chesapeaki]
MTDSIDGWIRGVMSDLVEKSPNKHIWKGDSVPELSQEWAEGFKNQVAQRRASIMQEAKTRRASAEGGSSHLRATIEAEPTANPDAVIQEVERLFGEGALDEFSSCFVKHADYHDTIGSEDIPDCLYWLGKNPSQRIMKACIKHHEVRPDSNGRITFDKFVKFLKFYRYMEDSLFKENAGFGDEDLFWFQETFNKYAGRGSTRNGTQQKGLRGGDLWSCLHAIGREPSSNEDRDRVIGWVRELMLSKQVEGEDGENESSQNTLLDFHTFLHVVRYLVDDEVETSRRRERELIARASFNDDELQGFRQVFDSLDESGTGEIPLQQMKRLFETLGLKLNREQMQELIIMIREVDENDSLAIDFGEFSLLMRKLIDKNFAGLNDAADATLKKAKLKTPGQEMTNSRKNSNASGSGRQPRNMVVTSDMQDRQHIVARMRRASLANEQADALTAVSEGAKRRASKDLFGAQIEGALKAPPPPRASGDATALPQLDEMSEDDDSGLSSGTESYEESEPEEDEECGESEGGEGLQKANEEDSPQTQEQDGLLSTIKEEAMQEDSPQEAPGEALPETEGEDIKQEEPAQEDEEEIKQEEPAQEDEEEIKQEEPAQEGEKAVSGNEGGEPPQLTEQEKHVDE